MFGNKIFITPLTFIKINEILRIGQFAVDILSGIEIMITENSNESFSPSRNNVGRVVLICGVVAVVAVAVILVLLFQNNRGSSSPQTASTNNSEVSSLGGPQVIKTKNATGVLVNGFPQLPAYEGATVMTSYAGRLDGQVVYGATWEINEVNGHSVDKTSVREVMHWYEDDAFPESWIFDEPLQQSGDTTNPSKSWITVSKDGMLLTLTVEQNNVQAPVLVTAFVRPK